MSVFTCINIRVRLASLMLLLAASLPALAAEISGRVVGVADGDTLTLLTPDKRQVRIRLAEIDTPEKRQPYGTRAKQSLSDLCFGKPARVDVKTTDRYGRTVGRVYCAGIDANAEQVRRGAAWVYRKYTRDPKLYQLEAEARRERRGLWALSETQRVPPWEWRKAMRSGNRYGTGNRASRPTITRSPGFACGAKRTCGQMSSCAEARFYLENCGLSRLDRDRDGVPCGRLCQ